MHIDITDIQWYYEVNLNSSVLSNVSEFVWISEALYKYIALHTSA